MTSRAMMILLINVFIRIFLLLSLGIKSSTRDLCISSIEDFGFLMTMNLAFSDGDFNGSTLSLLGRNPVLHEYREVPIVGGSGVFRMARGIATAKTYTFNLLGDAIVEYNVIVSHY
ncbi:dirigent protein 22-like protein [Tanacetum coccineum]